MADGPHGNWEQHAHDAVVHTHRHFHVTHNFNPMTGGFDHLSSEHVHQHDHAAVTHAHWPHEDFEHEHEGEAHIHDHGEPVDEETSGALATAAKAAKKPAKRAAKTAKKAAGS